MPVSPATFSAPDILTDPTYDASAEVQRAVYDGRVLDFDGKIYRVMQTIYGRPGLEGRGSIYDGRTSWTGVRRTFEFPDATGCDFSLRLDRGVIGTGDRVNDAGVSVLSGTDFTLRTKLTGCGRGAGTLIKGASNFEVKTQFWDLYWTDTILPTDDQASGVRLINGCNNGIVRVMGRHSGGLVNGEYVNQWFRGLVSGASELISVPHPIISGCSQSIDLSGSDYNKYINIFGGVLSDPYTWGVKLANSAFGCEVSDMVIIRPGYAGVVISGPAGAVAQAPGYNRVKGTEVINPGSNGAFSGNSPAGYLVLPGIDPWTTLPSRSDFLSCKARDTQNVKTMVNAFRTQVSARRDSTCEGLGQSGAEYVGPWTLF